MSVGTNVRDRKYDINIANTTAMANGMKSDMAEPLMKRTGTKTMQMLSVETKAGTATCEAPVIIVSNRLLTLP